MIRDNSEIGMPSKLTANYLHLKMHMVHYRKGLNKSEIGTTEDSVVVVGVLIEVGSPLAAVASKVV